MYAESLTIVRGSMKKALVVGSTGLLGSRLTSQLLSSYNVTGTHHIAPPIAGIKSVRLNLSDHRDLTSFLSKEGFDLVVNCAGLTSVEGCESRPEAAWQLNACLPYYLARTTKDLGAFFIHISTDHFLSDRSEPRNEKSRMTAVNQYGLSKLAGEQFVRDVNPSSSIIRTNFFGHSDSKELSLLNFLTKNFRQGQTFTGFQDVIFSPLGVGVLVKAIARVADMELSGILNVAGKDVISKYEFARKVAMALSVDPGLVTAGESSVSISKTARPQYLALDGSSVQHELALEIPDLDSMIEMELENLI